MKGEQQQHGSLNPEGHTDSRNNNNGNTESHGADANNDGAAHSKHIQNTSSKIGPWKMGKTLGFGSSGRVRMAINEKTNQHAAVKIVSKSLFTKSQNNTSTIVEDQDNDFLPYGIEREIIIMKLLNHPNVLRLYDVWETDTDLYMVLEYVERGELFNLLVERGPLGEKEAVRFFRQIIIGISYCHALGIVHRDLKPENLLLDHKLNIKIADFGMAALETKEKLLETSCGSPHYAAPEIVSGMPYHGFESDVWSCGVILYALLTGRLPFDEEDGNIRKLLLKVQKGKFVMPSNISPDARDLLSKILTVDAEKRIGTRDILKHPLLKKYPNLKDSKSIRNLPREDTYLNPLANGGSENIDQSILNNLVILWHGKNKEDIIKSLKEPGANLEKTFYALLYNFKINVQLQSHLTSSSGDKHAQNQNQRQHQGASSATTLNNSEQQQTKTKTPSPQKQKRLSIYQMQQQQQQQQQQHPKGASTPSPPKHIVSSASSNSKKRLSTISVSSSHRRPVSFTKPSGNSSSNNTNTTATVSNVSSLSAHSLGSTPVKRTVTTSSHSASSSVDAAPPPVPHEILNGYTSSTPNTSLTAGDVTDSTLDYSTSGGDISQSHDFAVSESTSSSPPSAPLPSIVANSRRISRTISKRFSTSGSRASLYGATGSGSFGTLINAQTKLKHGSITTKLIATYAKLSELQDEDGAYIEQETRRTSQTFATLIDEVFEYEKHEQIRKEKIDLERKLQESKLKEEQAKLQKEKTVLEQQRRELKNQKEQERMKRMKHVSHAKLLKMEKKKQELEEMIAKLKQGFNDEGEEDDVYTSVSEDDESFDNYDRASKETDKFTQYSVSGENDTGFDFEDNVENHTSDSTPYEQDGVSVTKKVMVTEEHSEPQSETVTQKTTIRSASEPMSSKQFVSGAPSNLRDSLLDNNILASTQKRSFSLSTRPVSRLDPGLTPFEDYNKRASKGGSSRRASTRKSTISTVDEKSVEASDSDYEYNEEDEGYTTIIDEDEVERRIVESLRRSKFLGSQFDLAMKLAGGNASTTSPRKSILKPNQTTSKTVVSSKAHTKNSKERKSKINHLGYDDASPSVEELGESSKLNSEQAEESAGTHQKLTDVTVPNFTRESQDVKNNDKKRLSVLSLYSSKQSYRDLAAELKGDPEDKTVGPADAGRTEQNGKPADKEFVPEEAKVVSEDVSAVGKAVDSTNESEENPETMTKSKSNPVILNFADRYKARNNAEQGEVLSTQKDEVPIEKPAVENVDLPKLPPLDRTNTNGTGLGLLKDAEKKITNVTSKDAESASANVTEPLTGIVNSAKDNVAIKKVQVVQEVTAATIVSAPLLKNIPKKKSGIFRLFSSATESKVSPNSPSKNESNTQQNKATATASAVVPNLPVKKPATAKPVTNTVTSPIVHYDDSFVKVFCNNEKKSNIDQLTLLTIIYEQLTQWQRSKVGLKNVKMNSRQYLITGKISNDNILSLRSTTFQILCSLDGSDKKKFALLINKLSGSKKTFSKFITEFERFLRKQEIVV